MYEQSFVELERRLRSALVSIIIDIGKPFKVYCDVSYQGMSCVPIQEKRVVAYA